ncbi:hypothetical protein MRX96_014176 [Rhipicephalus microplus]
MYELGWSVVASAVVASARRTTRKEKACKAWTNQTVYFDVGPRSGAARLVAAPLSGTRSRHGKLPPAKGTSFPPEKRPRDTKRASAPAGTARELKMPPRSACSTVQCCGALVEV